MSRTEAAALACVVIGGLLVLSLAVTAGFAVLLCGLVQLTGVHLSFAPAWAAVVTGGAGCGVAGWLWVRPGRGR